MSSCSNEKDAPAATSFTENDAIAKVIAEYNHNRFEFPSRAGKLDGLIRGGGPAPGLQIPGQFESFVKQTGDGSYTVTLAVYWSAQDFRTEADSPDATLHHEWEYDVSSSRARLVRESGDVSPDRIE